MTRITINGKTGDSLYHDDTSPLIAFRPDGEKRFHYVTRPEHPATARNWHTDYEETE